MKLRAELIIEIEADDFVVAAEHQRRIEGILRAIREEYPSASLVLREKKERSAARKIRPEQPIRNITGKISRYAE